MSEASAYENCTVVEGHVQVTYITTNTNASPEQIAKIRFPKLREVTDFLVVYRVDTVKTLRYLFPNLAVIRGRNLFSNYALVVYEVSAPFPAIEPSELIGIYDINLIVHKHLTSRTNMPVSCVTSRAEHPS
jgi:hypothetical protein